MNRFGWAFAVVVLLVAAFLPAVAVAAPLPVGEGVRNLPGAGPLPIWRIAQFSMPGGGRLTTVLNICYDDQGPIDGQCGGEFPDTDRTGVATQIKGGRPGDAWALEIYDQGTCGAVQHVVASLSNIRVGSDGRRTSESRLSGTTLITLYKLIDKRLAVRASRGGLRCGAFGHFRGGGAFIA
jgi:hypothetical protein